MKYCYSLLLLLFVYTSTKAQITAYPDTSICPGETVQLGTTLVDDCGNCYTYQSLAYAPEPIGGEAITMVDDTYIGPYPIGFDFCFFGVEYDEFYLCSNGWISFVTPGGLWAGNWTPDGPIPDAAANVPRTAIFACWTDWNTGAISCDDCIHFETVGVTPNQRLLVTWDEVPLYSDACADDLGTFQIILHETSNFIDNHFTDAMVCPTWDDGVATQGLQNQTGTIAFTVEDRNATAWEAHDESWRWYTSTAEWYDEDGVLLGVGQVIDVTPDVTTTYTVVQTMCDGTTYTDDVTVEVGAAFDTEVLTTDITCGGDDNGTATVDVTGGLEPYTYEWSTGVTGTNTLTGLDGGTYSVIVTEAGGCQREYTFTINEPEELVANATDIIDNPCFDYEEGSATIEATGGTIPYAYSLDGSATTILNTFENLPAGTYTVTVTDANGCTVDETFTIEEPILLTANLTADDNSIFVGQTALITLTTSLPGITSVSWEPEVPCLDPPCFSTIVAPTTTTTYEVTVIDDQGCVATDTITIFVEFVPEVFFPNAFSPNGDSFNDQFAGVSYNVTDFHMSIFNRYGEMVYETNSFILGTGWDGNFEGEPQEMGTYVWQVTASFNNGEAYQGSGNVILVR